MAKTKKPVSSIALGITIAVICLAFIIAINPMKNNAISGSSVYVRYYGVSNYPLSSKAGKIQTYVKLTQPTLRNLNYASATIEVANDIVEAADFANGLVSAYQGDPPAPVPTSALDAIIAGAKVLTNKFESDTACLRTIGSRYGSRDSFSFVIVTELKYKQCWYYEYWLAAIARHSYYTTEGRYICSQDSNPLFTIEMGTGKTSTNTYGC